MYNFFLIILLGKLVEADQSVVCGGFILSHVEIDYTRIEVELYTKDGIWKDKTTCAPASGYYFIPIYDNGDYVLQLVPPPGWSLTPNIVHLSINGVSDLCSKGEDINFVFEGFGITGIVESYGMSGVGPAGVTVELKSDLEVRRTTTKQNGTFFFTPVYPGHYTVSILHKFWRIFKESINVHVNEGNTELPLGSLVISGYDVTGYVRSDGQPVDGIELVLFQDHDDVNTPYVAGCKKTIIEDLRGKGNQLCHLSSSARGNFTFDVVSSGHYFIMPYYEGNRIHFQPELIEFQVGHGSLLLPETFKIVGFSIIGIVRTSKDGKPIQGAHIFLNGNKVTATKRDGSYVLGNLKADTYIISATADNIQFESITLKVNQRVLQIPEFVPSSYRVCGSVLSEQVHNISIKPTGSTRTFVTETTRDGRFCANLSHGKYRMKVILNEYEKSLGIQYFPLFYDFEVIDRPLMDIAFSQLKATVVGKVVCDNQEECIGINIIMQSLLSGTPKEHKISIIPLLSNGTYIFQDVKQGSYEISLATNKFCWKTSVQKISVNSVTELVPPFVQTGYSVVFISSHTSKVLYTENEKDKSLDIKKGKTSLCLQQPGSYKFELESCHVYETNLISFNTNSEEHEIHLTATEHTILVEIECEENYGELYMIVNRDGNKTQEGPLQFGDKRYFISFIMQPTDIVRLVPHSEVLYVYPPIIAIEGEEDCTNVGAKFFAKKGRIFVGYVSPPIEGVSISVVADNSDILTNETDKNGRYRFPPQDDSREYTLLASKQSYVLLGPDEQGNFIAHKLAKISTSVVFSDNNEPLQGVLLSLSGGQGYRKNIPTGEDGVVTFDSLIPGEYFLKPMKKEYSFEPSTKLIVAEEGLAISITLKGKRFAYSGYGQVTSLNGDFEERVTILASGLENCSRLFEEATSESNGQFRIRGLHPYCTYNVKVKRIAEDKRIEWGSPTSLNISLLENDIHGLNFTVFKPAVSTDVMVRVFCKNLELYKTLRITLSRDSHTSSLIHTTKLENFKLTKNNVGILLFLPPLPLDGKTYYLQVESTAFYEDSGEEDAYYFTTDSSFKYIDVDCHSRRGSGQNLKQTSLCTILIFFISLLVFYNIECTSQFFREQFNRLNISQAFHRLRPLPIAPEFVIDKNEISQIVESINPTKRRLKPKKT